MIIGDLPCARPTVPTKEPRAPLPAIGLPRSAGRPGGSAGCHVLARDAPLQRNADDLPIAEDASLPRRLHVRRRRPPDHAALAVRGRYVSLSALPGSTASRRLVASMEHRCGRPAFRKDRSWIGVAESIFLEIGYF